MNKKIIIIGAGSAGKDIANEIKKKEIFGKVIAFIDDDKSLIGTKIDEIDVLGPIKNIKEINKNLNANEVIIAIPSADKTKLNKIYNTLKRAKFEKIKILPALSQVISGDAHLILTRDINTQDLLGRDPITIDLKESLKYLTNKRVIITGAGGSIGSEISKQLLYAKAKRLYLIDYSEEQIYKIQKSLEELQKESVGEKTIVVPIICNLQDKDHLEHIIPQLKADIIFHCAAYKHVPIMEENKIECIKNNIFGTKYLVDVASKNSIKKFVLISTDKAVEPSSVYGVSKHICEEIVLEKASDDNNFMIVRFGNVLNSSGSIVPLLKSQIDSGGPVTITDKDVKRFFMTIPEACSLVLKAGGVGKSAQTYILDMGEPIKILDLAKTMIEFSGYKPKSEIPIKFIGLRKGEKLNERLWEVNESTSPTEYNRILRLNRRKNKYNPNTIIESLKNICYLNDKDINSYRNNEKLIEILKKYYPSLKNDI